MANSLQAVLNRARSEPEEGKNGINKTVKKKESEKRESVKPSRVNTVLIGGHFRPEVLKQLRIIAAEEGTTNQALLEQALDLLFVKKGKGRIIDL